MSEPPKVVEVPLGVAVAVATEESVVDTINGVPELKFQYVMRTACDWAVSNMPPTPIRPIRSDFFMMSFPEPRAATALRGPSLIHSTIVFGTTRCDTD
jgi:hypothetical protein